MVYFSLMTRHRKVITSLAIIGFTTLTNAKAAGLTFAQDDPRVPEELYTPPQQPWPEERISCSIFDGVEESTTRTIVMELDGTKELLSFDPVINKWKERGGVVRWHTEEQIGVARGDLFDREEPDLLSELNFQGGIKEGDVVRFHGLLERVNDGRLEQWILLPNVSLTHHYENGNYRTFTISHRFVPMKIGGSVHIESPPPGPSYIP